MASNFKSILRSMLIAIAILASSFNAFCQEDETLDPYYDQPIKVRKINEAKRKALIKDLNYTETAKPEKEKEKKPEKKELENIGNGVVNFGPIAKIIIYVAAIFLIAFILIYLLKANLFANKSIKSKIKPITIENLEEQLHESDLDHFLKEATKVGNYRLAIRIYYLMILKELSIRNFIYWKKDKTNREYMNEMSAKKNSALFNQITRTFEITWYGKTEINETEYLSISPAFKQFIEGLNSTHNA